MKPMMRHAAQAAACYFAASFAAGFVVGAFRVLVLAPRIGEIPAVTAELPVMIAVSWFACAWVADRFRVPRRLAVRIAMGGIAFALLMTAEFLLAIVAFGRTPAAFVEALATPAGAIGLAGQIVFGLLPAIQAMLRRTS